MVNYCQPLNGIEACVEFEDDNGIMNQGLFAMRWNSQAFEYASEAALDNRLEVTCEYGKILHDGDDEQEDDVSKL